MGPALVLALLLHQAPPQRGALVLLSRRVGASPQIADSVTRDLRKALAYEGIESPIAVADLPARLLAAGVKDVKDCGAKPECVVAAGRRLTAANVISLSVTQAANEVTIQVEGLKTVDGARFAADTFYVPAGELGGVFTAFAPFAARVRNALVPPLGPRELVAVAPPVAAVAAPPVRPPVPDVPRQEAPPRILPSPVLTAPPLPLVAKSGPSPKRIGALAMGGGAVILAGLSVGLAAAGSSGRARLNERLSTGGDQPGSPLTHAQAQALASSSNAQFTGALLSGIAAVALGTAAGVVWFRAE